jgi:hypothetical protein
VVTANGIGPIEGGMGVRQLEEGLMQDHLPLWVKSQAFRLMDKKNKQLKYIIINFFQHTLFKKA